MFHIFADATVFPDSGALDWANLITSGGFGALVWYLITKYIPAQTAAFENAVRKEREAFTQMLEQERKSFREVNEQQRIDFKDELGKQRDAFKAVYNNSMDKLTLILSGKISPETARRWLVLGQEKPDFSQDDNSAIVNSQSRDTEHAS